MDRVVVVGGGLAGGRAVVELREQGFAGKIILVSAEARRPYDRPPLSKAVLAGRTDDTTLPFDLDGVELLLGRRATGLRPGVVETDGGPVGYDGLVLATGASPVLLPGPGPQRVLRTMDEALALRDALRPGVRLAVVGAGWIGAEVATHAASVGAAVTVVEAGSAPLLAALGASVGGHTVPWYAQAGVELRLGTAVARVIPGGLELAGGEILPADEVVVGVGVRPDVSWLESSGLELDRGVVVDEWLAATGPGYPPGSVVAVGDCAAWWSRRYGRRLRVEHWECAQESPRIAVATLLRSASAGQRPASSDAAAGLAAAAGQDGAAGPDEAAGLDAAVGPAGGAVAAGAVVPAGRRDPAEVPAEAYDPVPYFWSQQFGRMVQFAGLPGPDSRLVVRGDPTAVAPAGSRRPAGWSAGWFAPDGRLVALVTVSRPMDMVAGRRLLTAGAAPDADRFADPDVPMKEMAAAQPA